MTQGGKDKKVSEPCQMSPCCEELRPLSPFQVSAGHRMGMSLTLTLIHHDGPRVGIDLTCEWKRQGGGDVPDEKATGSSWRFMQVGLMVKDMDQAIKGLSTLGFGPFKPKHFPPGTKFVTTGEPAVGEDEVQRTTLGGVELELICPAGETTAWGQWLSKHGDGVHHVCFEVTDLQEELTRLQKEGCTVLCQFSFNDDGGLAFVDVGAAGLVFELLQLPKDREARKYPLSED
jgi:methylmalonyl-CoA/ethylmalonyl-CoA epimerase